MNAKLISLGLLVTVMLATIQPLRAHMYVRSSPDAAGIELVPPVLDGYAISKNWNHRLGGNTIEEGALFTPVTGGADVQLDFYRNSGAPHNGIGCYLMQGERLRSQKLMMLPTRNGPESFLAAYMSDGHELRLALSTECRAAGCSEETIRTGFDINRFNALFTDTAPGVVPVSIMLKQPYDSRDDMAVHEADLLAQATRVIQLLDLESARRLASKQSSFQ